MGTVYEAEELSTGRRVALKMLAQQLDSPEMRQRFLREGRLAASVNHPHSLYVFGSEEIEDTPVITMEIAAGGTLEDRLKARGPLPVEEAVDAILDVLAGLEAASAAGVLHRDVKPSNCFVGPDGAVKVGDFGLSVSTLAREDSYATASGVIMGTPAYAAPEQLRGDNLDVRADVYSVGATLFALLTAKAPFGGKNAVQVVTNVIDQEPRPLRELRDDVPSALERVVARCLAKDPAGRFNDHTALRDALLPFSSAEPEPASMKVRAAAGWIDYLIAFLVPYVVVMLHAGGGELFVRPLADRTLYAARYYLAVFAVGFLYFALAEGVWGAGVGKRLKGLRVVRPGGRRAGVVRALVRILVPILTIEGVRMPIMLASISDYDVTGFQVLLLIVTANVCPWIPVLFTLRARPENGFATLWDLLSGTRVVHERRGLRRSPIAPLDAVPQSESVRTIGPFEVHGEVAPGRWLAATDPVLRREVWLLRRGELEPSDARRNVSRPGRLRWLQAVEAGDATWDAFEAPRGLPLAQVVAGGLRLPWFSLRHHLHDLAAELWSASRDGTLPPVLSLDHVWLTARGDAVLLDEPWPAVEAPAETIPVGDLAGQQRFLSTIGELVEPTGLPLHARPVLQNVAAGRFERLSFFTGTVRGLLERPAEVGRGIRAGSIFMLPAYVWIAVYLGTYHGGGDEPAEGTLAAGLLVTTAAVLGAIAGLQLLALPLRTTASHAIYRLAVIDHAGKPAGWGVLLARWALVWLPLFGALGLATALPEAASTPASIGVLLLWIAAAVHTALHPHRGWHDHVARTWVVRR